MSLLKSRESVVARSLPVTLAVSAGAVTGLGFRNTSALQPDLVVVLGLAGFALLVGASAVSSP